MTDDANRIDARGLSCPQPVLLATEQMDKAGQGRIEVLTDCGASPENVGRAAASKGWRLVSSTEEAGAVRLVLEKP